jgi:hypothetical protein
MKHHFKERIMAKKKPQLCERIVWLSLSTYKLQIWSERPRWKVPPSDGLKTTLPGEFTGGVKGSELYMSFPKDSMPEIPLEIGQARQVLMSVDIAVLPEGEVFTVKNLKQSTF